MPTLVVVLQGHVGASRGVVQANVEASRGVVRPCRREPRRGVRDAEACLGKACRTEASVGYACPCHGEPRRRKPMWRQVEALRAYVEAS